ncbi:NUDIX hydrolase N-terminal domain-containing protein [Nostoc flagelliforme FACHB-838]|uniref:NUDIX hydrolase N-terminal domain-containing protein n=1 Tax=Nostoc flagelliforme FACHB-838 TaxID=2692904 RepID=A0ABR8E3T7_9NOSO|nr:NUDIX hydrolase N-terminal domain-containing protein [Nostoc flagelliforme FACHB-838]
MANDDTLSIIELLEELRAIAQLGLNYSKDVYDRERYERLLALASAQYSALCSLPSSEVEKRFRTELGYITPKVGVSAAILNDQGQLLLVQRTDDSTWCLPCGWAEVRETPQQSIVREVLEETGLLVEVGSLIRLGWRMPGDFGQPHTTYHLQFYCTVVGGTLLELHETTKIGYYYIWSINRWHLDHQVEAEAAHQYWRNQRSQG